MLRTLFIGLAVASLLQTACSSHSNSDGDAGCAVVSLVADIWPDTGSAHPGSVLVHEDRLYLRADDGVHGQELWMIDAETGAELFVDVVPGSDGSSPANLTVLDGRLYFSAQNSASGRELWTVDLADPAAGAQQLADINPGRDDSDPGTTDDFRTANSMAVLNGKLYFLADDGVHGEELWMFDPASGVSLVADLQPGAVGAYIDDLTVAGNLLYFTAFTDTRGGDLWFLDSTFGSLNRVDIRTDPDVFGYPDDLTVYDGRLFFSANDGIHGDELWSHDPLAGPWMVADIAPGSDGSYPGGLLVMNDQLYLVAADGIGGARLWVYDPIESIRLAGDTASGMDFWLRDGDLLELDGTLYFFAYNPFYGYELWRYDPLAGASLVVDTIPGLGDTGDDDPEPPSHLRLFDGRLFFSAYDGVSTYGRTTWVYDPLTGADTITELWPGSGIEAVPNWSVALNGRVYFSADDDVHGQELWVVDRSCTG